MLYLSVIGAQDFKHATDTDFYLINKAAENTAELKYSLDLYKAGNQKEAIRIFNNYFNDKLAKRYFFNWKTFNSKYEQYKSEYPDKIESHRRRANEMTSFYNPVNSWKLPQLSQTGKHISAYEFRHLARQHKAIDIAFLFADSGSDSLKSFICKLVESLETAYQKDDYERKGNGIFESFRAGYRLFNWLFAYNVFLATDALSEREKFNFLKAFYYHAEELYKDTRKYRAGNHQTKGLMSLAVTSILFPEFDNGKWFEGAIARILDHLDREINPDGFQMERSVHYHMGDIDNYFYVYYLAKINNKKLPQLFEDRFKSMFNALAQIAYPNKTLPVLQDDTDNPFAEYNNMKSVMTLGTVLFKEPLFEYFSAKEIDASKFWFVRDEDRTNLKHMAPEKPDYLSVSLPVTGYYVMRSGWDLDDPMVVIDAGLSNKKPDHQQGGMLGIQLYANKNYMLPNYQVRYYKKEYQYFKNSFTKNVALVDSIPLGRKWKPNSGGSGFGKFLDLPNPVTDTFFTSKAFDYYSGHLTYENCDWNRQIIFAGGSLIIVRDYLSSSESRNYNQIWQGFFSKENKNHFRKTFSNGSGLDLVQLNDFSSYQLAEPKWGKGSIVFNVNDVEQTEFLTLLYPFEEFDTRIDERYSLSKVKIGEWKYTSNQLKFNGIAINAKHILFNESMIIAFNTESINDYELNGDENNNFIFSLPDKKIYVINGDKNFKLAEGFNIHLLEK